MVLLGFTDEKEEQPDQKSQQGLTAADSWSSATSLDRFIPPTITRSLLSIYRCRPGEQLQLQVEYFSPSVQCHCTWQVQYSPTSQPQSIQNGQIINTNYSSTLTIDSITSRLQGLYLFFVENVYGRATTETRVIVHSTPTDDDELGMSNIRGHSLSYLLGCFLEFQEAAEDVTTSKSEIDDDGFLQLGSPHHKRISRIHHTPLDESIEYEDLTVRIPGGATEEITIHTDFAPPTPRYSVTEESTTTSQVLVLLRTKASRSLFSLQTDDNQTNRFTSQLEQISSMASSLTSDAHQQQSLSVSAESSAMDGFRTELYVHACL